MYTVGEALQLEVFKDCQVVAGRVGLNRPIRWAHAIDVPDASNWLRGGELVLTTAISLAKDPESRQEFVRALNTKNAAGVLISVGEFIARVPEEMIAIANDLGLPIIEAPWTTHLVDVSEPINSRIVSEQFVLLQRSSRIHRMLTQLVLDGGGLHELAHTLAELMERPVTIESPNFELLAYADWGKTDQARLDSISQMRSPAALVAELDRRGDLAQLRLARQPLMIAPTPEAGMTMERIVAPIVFGGEIYGYTWLIADARPLGELDRMAIESAATIAALIMLREQAIQETENRLKGSFLIRLLQDGFEDANALLHGIEQFGINFNQPYQVMVIGASPNSTIPPMHLMRQLSLLTSGQGMLMGLYGNEIVAIAETAKVQNLADKITTTHPNLWVGLGLPVKDPTDLRQSYDQGREAMDIGRQLRSEIPVVSYQDLGYLHLLYRAPQEYSSQNIYDHKIQRLFMHDQAHSGELLNTLEFYLTHGCNALETARQLHIHRSTLIYRLQRIKDLCQLDLSDAQVRINLQVFIQMFHMQKRNG